MSTRPDLARTVLQQLAAEIRAGRQVGRMPHVVGQTLMAVLAGLEGADRGDNGQSDPA